MPYQSESELENLLIKRMQANQRYEYINITNEETLESNFRAKLDALNSENLNGKELSDKEFEHVLIYLKGKSIFQCAKQLRDKHELLRDNGESVFIKFIDFDNVEANLFQIANQITMIRTYENRYDLTLLINGLPIVQMELKRRGLSIKEAFNQFCRYARHSFDGLFKYLQILVISNGVDTKYMANSDKPFEFSHTFFWTDAENHRITNLQDFADAFLKPKHLIDMLGTYTVLNDTDKEMMVMRPYQVYATDAAVKMARDTSNNCYIWACTGSGKTLTSFKAAQILGQDRTIAKVVFLVDRNDLDNQTITEFNKFEADSVDTTANSWTLVKQLKNPQVRLIVTTIQKLNNVVKNNKYEKDVAPYADQKVIFIVDECHRSQFGEMSTAIRRFFHKSQFIGFTGTPRFVENQSQDGRTTADIFGRCVHTYLTKDAIHDNNVLGFSVEYIKTFDGQYDRDDDEMVYGINTDEVYDNPTRIALVANHIICNHNAKCSHRKYCAIFAVSGIPMLLKYYEQFKTIKHDLNIAAVYTYQANESMDGKAEHSRESLEKIISEYNKTYGTNYSTDTFDAYDKDIQKRLKAGQIDILIVVAMHLTGLDAKKVSTLYVDKPMKYHDLIQAFSRTNRVYDATKVWGNIVCYRNLKRRTDEAICLFSNTDNINDVLYKDFGTYLIDFKAAISKIFQIADSPAHVDTLESEVDQEKFIKAFKDAAQLLLALKTFTEFEFSEDLTGISEQTYEDYKSKYMLLYEQNKCNREGEKTSILDEIDFCIELIQTDRINVAYILNLIKNINRDTKEARDKDVEHIIREIERSDNAPLRKKAELIKAFLLEQLPAIPVEVDMEFAYSEYENESRNKEIETFAEENGVDKEFIKREISEYEFTGATNKTRVQDSIQKPFLVKKKLTELILEFIRENVVKYQ